MRLLAALAVMVLGTLCASAVAQSRQLLTFEEAKQRADAGDAFAQAVVALHYQLGWNTEKNAELAARYAIASANAGDPYGQFRLGALLRAGEGLPKDEQQGLAYQAASFDGLDQMTGDPYAVTALGVMIFQGKAVWQNVPQEKRRQQAAQLYRRAADAGFAPAQFNYAMALNDGHGVRQHPVLSEQYLSEARGAAYPLAVSLTAKQEQTIFATQVSEPINISQFSIPGFFQDKSSDAELPKALVEHFLETDADLNRAYERLRAVLKPEQSQYLQRTQRQWLLYRDESSQAVEPAQQRLEALISETIKRTATLECAALNPDELVGHESQGIQCWEGMHAELLAHLAPILPDDKYQSLLDDQGQWQEQARRTSRWASAEVIKSLNEERYNKLEALVQKVTRESERLYSPERIVEVLNELKQAWIRNNAQTGDKPLAQSPVRVCVPVKPVNLFEAHVCSKLEKLLTLEQRRGSSFTFQSALRMWDLRSGRLIGQVFLPYSVFELWIDEEACRLMVLMGPAVWQDSAPSTYYECDLRSIAGTIIVNPSDVYPLKEMLTRNEGVRKAALYPSDVDVSWAAERLEPEQEEASPEAGNFLHTTDRWSLTTDGVLTDKYSALPKRSIGTEIQLLTPGKGILAVSNGDFIVVGEEGAWLVAPSELSATQLSEHIPDQLRSATRILKVCAPLDATTQHFSVIADSGLWVLEKSGRWSLLNHFGESRNYIQMVFGGEKPRVFMFEPIDGLDSANGERIGVKVSSFLSEKIGDILLPLPRKLVHDPTVVSVTSNINGGLLGFTIRADGSSLGNYFNMLSVANLTTRDPAKIYDLGAGQRLAFGLLSDGYPQDQKVIMGKDDGDIVIKSSPNSNPVASYDSPEAAYINEFAVAPDRSAVFLPTESGPVIKVAIDSLVQLNALCQIFAFGNGEVVVMDPSGAYYAGRKEGVELLAFADSLGVYPFEQFDLRLNRPDIVLERLGAPAEAVAIAQQLREKRLKRMGVTEEMLKPDFHVPELEIVGDVPSATDGGEINLKIKASDSKYPLERLKVFVNNVPVNGRDGELLREEGKSDEGLLGRITNAFADGPAGPQSLERTVPIKLAVGRNKIQVSVRNNAGAESLYANAEVNCSANRPKPTLYGVALGVSEYSNPDWNLKYAAKDAQDVMARLKPRAGDNYGEVKELLLTDKEVTKESIAKIRDFLSGATIDDTVLMFVAGHGLLDSKYDYYFGTTDIDFNNPADKGIAFEEFDDLLAELSSLKKSLLIDTCHAGELDEEEKTLLASAGGVSAALPTANGVAVRSIGTRGMNVKAVEGAKGASEWYDRLQGLFVDLRRGSGSTILSSSAGAEYALESSEQQNGLFTYAVLEALDGKADADTDKDGSIEMSELGEYVKKRVSELTNNKQTPNTRRVNLEGDFVLAETK